MIRFLRIAISALIVVALLGFAYANRHEVIVSFDPFASRESAALAVAAPLFEVMIAAAMLGVIAGATRTRLWRPVSAERGRSGATSAPQNVGRGHE